MTPPLGKSRRGSAVKPGVIRLPAPVQVTVQMTVR
jgi:hypothetical protein